jgi:hypothetical protein
MAGLTSSEGFGTLNYVDLCVFVLVSFVAIAMIVWMVALMYRAYSVSCNIKGARAVITFIVSIVGAEVLSKSSILLLLR